MRDSLNIVFGQAIWAVAQASLLLYLAQLSGVKLVGVTTAGFAVFAPVALFLSLNLRTSVAINLLLGVPYSFLVLVRAATSFVAVVVAASVAYMVAPDTNLAICAWLLLTTKFIDTLADLNVGFFQRDNCMGFIVQSLSARGLALLVAIGVSIVGQLDPLYFCAIAAAIYGLTFLLFDMRKMLSGAAKNDKVSGGSLINATVETVRSNWMSALFPAADNLHQNCLRLGATLLFDIEIVGLIGLALTAYAPMQQVVSAVGMKVLPQLRYRQQAGDEAGFHKLNRFGMAFGIGIALFTALAAWLVPTFLYELVFSADGELAKHATVMIGLAHVLLPMSGFMSQSLITSDNRIRYLLGPTLAVGVFWAGLGVLYVSTSISLWEMCTTVLVASALRVWVSWSGHFDQKKVGK